jgi:predicted secreted protein
VTAETIRCAVGEEFEVRLESTPTTGYIWEVAQLPETVELLGTEFEPSGGEPQAGAPGNQLFRFRAGQPGQYQIDFVLKRQWELEAIRSRTVSVQVN